ncbi:OLC1v1004678C1 [Oldenlandia corymbosa var. corymbosa]|uniref:OLC1v1004678C1 n=1 Tax=Oldenlandia corymbosa var. corymbosa TaxID=529605 RepID=A0AAV1DD42_OLDCO|nr:OLC1v1004678C1 [Oldenlandia corymbosa var. corymbosa]
MSSSATTAGTGAGITEVHPDIIQTHILTRLDGPTLASASCASSRLHDLCIEENLWKRICNDNWPATADPSVQQIISTFPAGHRSFYSDSFPALPDPKRHPGQRRRPESSGEMIGKIETRELVSAVDIHYGDQLLYSKVVTTEASSGWFMCSPFRIDLLDPKEIVPTSVKLDVEGEEEKTMKSVEENMRLSWILIDPVKKRAVNMSSIRPVEVRRHWLTGEIQVRYSTVMACAANTAGSSAGGFVNCKIMVTCGAGKESGDLQVKEVSMQVEDMEGKIISGKDSLVILQEGMDGKRRKVEVGEEKRMYELFLESRREWRERKQSRERRLDMVCIATGVSIFMAFWIFVLFR